MKLDGIIDRSDCEEIEMVAHTGAKYQFPYAQMDPRPTTKNPVERIYVDPELAREGVTYFLASGEEGAVLLDHVQALRNERARLTSKRYKRRRRRRPRKISTKRIVRFKE